MRWAFRDLIRNWRWTLFMVIGLSLGVTSLMLVSGFRGGVEKYLEANAQNLLAADFSIEVRREFKPSEEEIILREMSSSFEKSLSYEFFAMMSAKGQSKLIQVKVIDDSYPFYGALELINGEKFENKSNKEFLTTQGALLFSELQDQLNLKIGDEFQLGNSNFKISNFITKDDTQTFRSASLAPRVYIHLNQLKKTGLIQFGSTFSKAYLFKVPNIDIKDFQLSELKSKLEKSLKDPSIQIQTAKTASENSGRQLKYLSDFLGISALVALLMTTLGGIYLFRYYLEKKTKDIAILKTFGLLERETFIYLSMQSLMLGILTSIVSIFLFEFIKFFVDSQISQLIGTHLEFNFSISDYLVISFALIFMSWIIHIPQILNISQTRPLWLLSDYNFRNKTTTFQALFYVASGLFFWGIACLQSHSYKIGSIFIGVIFAVALSVSMTLYLSRFLLQKSSFRMSWVGKYSLLYFSRNSIKTFFTLLTLSLGIGFLNLIPQLKVTLQSELAAESSENLPSLFMFDIQSEQWEPLKIFLDQEKVRIIKSSPLVRSRILKVNEESYERASENESIATTREEEQDVRFRNRGVNLTYRNELSTSEKLIEGRAFSKNTSEMAEISLESSYADRLKINLNDVLTFDIQGFEIKGKVVNFRKVQWTRFEPNFFIVFQEGFIENAPKIYLAATEKISKDRKSMMMNSISTQFPNVSMIDVEKTVENVLNLLDKMSLVVKVMAMISFISGLLILFSMIQIQATERNWEVNMLKIFGANQIDLVKYLLTSILIVVGLALVIGNLMSAAVSGILSYQLFSTVPSFDLGFLVISILCVYIVTIGMSLTSMFNLFSKRPLLNLNIKS